MGSQSSVKENNEEKIRKVEVHLRMQEKCKYPCKAMEICNGKVVMLVGSHNLIKNDTIAFWKLFDNDGGIILPTSCNAPMICLRHQEFENNYSKVGLKISKDAKYVIIFINYGETIKIIPISTIKEKVQHKSETHIDINITNEGVDIKGPFNLPQEHGKLCVEYIGNDRFVIGHCPKQDLKAEMWPITFYVYCTQSGKLLSKLEAKIPNYNQKEKYGYTNISKLNHLRISDNNVISFWSSCLNYRYLFDEMGKMHLLNYAAQSSSKNESDISGMYRHPRIFSPSGTLMCEVYRSSIEIHSYSSTGCYVINHWEQVISNSVFMAHWHNENILIFFDGWKVYVIKSAHLIKEKCSMLKEFFTPNISKILLEMVGFEYFGEWIAQNDKKNRAFGFIRRVMRGELHLNAYFGKDKQYVVITQTRGGIRHIVVDLDVKYRCKPTLVHK